MANDGLRINVKGVDKALKRAKDAHADIVKGLETETQKAALRVANDAAENAPRRDGFLKNSITASPKRLEKFTWQVGSDRQYARRQEYEHKTRKGFFRKALFNERTRFRKAIERILKRSRGGDV